MNIPLKNPCLECDHHLSGGDKNRCECIDCEKRISYVNAIGTHPGTPVNEGVFLEGGTGNDAKKILKTLNKIEQVPSEKPKDLQSEKDQFIENHIKSMCEDAGMTIEQLRAGIQGTTNKQRRHKFNEVRDRIIKSLVSGDFGRLSQWKIAKYLNVSNNAISTRMKAAGISPMCKTGVRGGRIVASKQKKPEKAAAAKPQIKPPLQIILKLDFVAFPEIYDDLQALAKQELRSIENQALYIFKQLHERGLNIPEI